MQNKRVALDYPDALEQAWLRNACGVTGKSTARDAVIALEHDAGLLSDTFTTGRDPAFGGYRSSRHGLAAYGLFFFPRSFIRTRLVLEECAEWMADRRAKEIRIADLGAGTGAAGLGALAALHAHQPGLSCHLDMIDAFPDGMDLARTMFNAGRSLWPNAEIKTRIADASKVELERRYDLIICSFAVNEWMENAAVANLEAWVEAQLRALHPGGLLVLMDPALRTSVDRIVALRDWVAANGLARIMAPCPHSAPCPMRAGKRGWCHEVRQWNVPPSMKLINRGLQRDIHLLKFSFLVLANEPPAQNLAAWARLVSPLSREKGKYTCHACGPDGQLHHYEWLTRGLSEEQIATSESLERGDRIVMVKGKLLGDGMTERMEKPVEGINLQH